MGELSEEARWFLAVASHFVKDEATLKWFVDGNRGGLGDLNANEKDEVWQILRKMAGRQPIGEN